MMNIRCAKELPRFTVGKGKNTNIRITKTKTITGFKIQNTKKVHKYVKIQLKKFARTNLC